LIQFAAHHGGRVLRIGHRGAAALEPENTLRSLQRALELGVDLVEFDVLDLRDGTLVLAHSDDLLEVSHGAARGRVRPQSLAELRTIAPKLPTLDEALGFVTASNATVGVHVDLKLAGDGTAVVEALQRFGLVERALVSSFSSRHLRRLAELEPRLRLGLTYPHDRFGLASRRVGPLLPATLGALRRRLPTRIDLLLDRGRASTAVLHHGVVSRAVVERCHARGVPVVVWTVNAPALMRQLEHLGVDAIVTDDPRIFDG
jgi:glycerophosphoryl diester phosphodiesterase